GMGSGGMGGMSGGGMGGMGGNTGSSLPGMFTPGGGGMGGMSGRMGGMGGGDMSGGMGGMSGGMSGMSGGMGDMSGGMGGMSGGMSGMSGGMGGNAANNQWWVYTRTPPTVMVEAKYRLFRYFDFTVEPGKSYQYRVRLAVKNPNFRLTDKFLDGEAAKTKLEPGLWTDFSYPSGPVAVNSNARILAKSVGNLPSANRAWQPQNATVSSIVFDASDNEDYIARDKTVAQGMVLNFMRTSGERVSNLSSPSGMSGDSSMMSGMSGGMGTTRPTGRTATQQARGTTKTLDHVSGECLLDVVGRRRLIGSNNEHTPAGQVLLMSFDGTISIQSVKTNKLELDRYEKPAATTGMMGSGMMP
ncbi:MAG: hypothetical protein FWD31_10745, partial [Planctomycetaceae bacterium]|nr:hypothetical protein [Planctomycetaceae bacterium]